MPLYNKNRNPLDLGQTYLDHVLAMTAEDLHHKADIAAELAYRDNIISELRTEIERMLLVKEAVIAMAEDGWLHFGTEGMTEAQSKCSEAYRAIQETKEKQ